MRPSSARRCALCLAAGAPCKDGAQDEPGAGSCERVGSFVFKVAQTPSTVRVTVGFEVQWNGYAQLRINAPGKCLTM
jgi:hypothetical protein